MSRIERGICVVVFGLSGFALVRGCVEVLTTQQQPTKLDGTRSTEFEREDFIRAENADDLVFIYCDGIESESQRLGCLSHVEVEDVCIADTDARMWAIDEFIGEYGYDPCE